MEKKRIKREIFVSETADNFLKRIKEEGGDDMAFSGVLFEMAIQMVRNGHITWNENGFECRTEKGVVTINVGKPREAAPTTNPAKPIAGKSPLGSLADIAKSMKINNPNKKDGD